MSVPLGAARKLVERPDPATRGLWARAAALLARQALEESLRDVLPTPERLAIPFATQLLCLREYLEPALADQAAHTWSALSAACHHHGYGLAPTASELRGWLDEVERVARSRG